MRTRRILAVAIGLLLLGNGVALAIRPAGEERLADVIPDREVALLQADIGSARVLLLAPRRNRESGRLRLVVAYRQRDRWRSVDVAPVRGDSDAAWAATEGSGPVPAFSAVYGRAPGDKVVVRWRDGRMTSPTPVDGAYLSVRRGRVNSDGVELNPAPTPTTTTAAP